MMTKSTFFFLAAVATASLPRATSTCSSAVQAILASPDAACVNPTGLKAYLNLASQNVTVDRAKSTVETWLTSYCALSSCSSATVDRVAKNISASCGSDPSILIAGYSFTRQMLCFKDTTAGKFCLTESIKSAGIAGAAPDLMILDLIVASGSRGSTCNECTKARYQLTVQAGIGSTTTSIGAICGANFVSTLNSTVVGVTQAVIDDSANANGALARALNSGTGVLVLAMSGLFALL
ncbi:hypothetical protein B0H19DRAFT_1270106 [Mycena capillaripes]|nr:hypothetical protein B0H19DRAFT_1270106 [Mycena capillaripes]